MRWRLMRLGLPFLLAAAALGGMLTTPRLSGAVPPGIDVQTDGQTVVWVYSHYTTTLYLRPATGGEPQEVAIGTPNDNPSLVESPDVGGDYLVWQEGTYTTTRLNGQAYLKRHTADTSGRSG